MIVGWAVLVYSLCYVGALFAIAWWGDRMARRRGRVAAHPIIYALSLAVYCTSWSFYGSVGSAAVTGYGFLPIYIGPILLFTLGWPLLRKIVRIAKAQNITSIADFIAARYGKSQPVAAVVSAMALFGSLPYMALQLKAVSGSFTVLLGYPEVIMPGAVPDEAPWQDTALAAAVVLAAFATLFGTRHVDATEHNDGLILAIAAEALLKLAAFLAIGVYVTWGLFGGPGELIGNAIAEPELTRLFGSGVDGGTWMTMTGLAVLSVLCLPRMFHVAVVENRSESHIRTATWVFPLYLVAIAIFVVPIAAAGLLLFPQGSVQPDFFMLALPMTGQQELLALIAFIGGLSAATGMAIVSSIAVSNMVSNDLVIPLLLRRQARYLREGTDMRGVILRLRRATIVGLMLLAYGYHRAVGDNVPLASIGLVSLAAVAQFAPPLIGGLIWRGATAAGAFWGMVLGFLVWIYTLLLPSVAQVGLIGPTLTQTGLFGFGVLMPQRLFGVRFDPFIHGVFWSLLINVLVFLAVSLRTVPRPIERLQASAFVDPEPEWEGIAASVRTGPVTSEELRAVASRYLGPETVRRSFATLEAEDGGAVPSETISLRLIRHTERLLASAIGAGSARLVMASVLERNDIGKGNALQILDHATAAIQYNRDLLQTTIDNVSQGIAVFDKNFRLVCWNHHFRRLLDLTDDVCRVGASLEAMLRVSYTRGHSRPGSSDDAVAGELGRFASSIAAPVEYHRPDGCIIEMRTCHMPGGGTVATYSDITERVRSAAALAEANESLERRVRRRTAELARAKAAADEANRDKTRFLAAASHDLLQPLNAARLYASSLLERRLGEKNAELMRKLDGALMSVEDLLGELLDISKLDAGIVTPEVRTFSLDALFASLSVEFTPLAEQRGLSLRVVPCRLSVESDWRLLHRVLQNLLANAIRYTPRGRVLMGARRSGSVAEIQVWDTGIGIAPEKQKLVFREFQRYADTPEVVHGLGLGLSIVERIGRVLRHPVCLDSTPGKGTVFRVRVPRGNAPDAPEVPVLAGFERQPGVSHRIKVLCIDNDATILDGMRTLLGNWGCDVRIAADCMQARREASAQVPDLLLVDLHLDGDNDGIACVEDLRQRLGSAIPAALITADRSEALKARARATGLPILNKPVRTAALRTLIRRLLASRNVSG